MSDVVLTGLVGTNPLGLLAALGVLDGVSRIHPEWHVRLSWTDGLVPYAVLHGVQNGDIDSVVQALDEDRKAWGSSVVLNWGPDGTPLDDIKPLPTDARRWVQSVLEVEGIRGQAEQRLIAGLFAEGVVDGKGNTKPTHLHFTAGQQGFLKMVRELERNVDAERLQEAIAGPWRFDSLLPVLGWDVSRGERVYAVRATNPSGDKKQGVPGADWLGFVGLSYFPVWPRNGKLFTTGCSVDWKKGTFTWPLWNRSLSPMVIRSMLRDSEIARLSTQQRGDLGVSAVMRAPIRRSDQGGYGSFGAPEPVMPATKRAQSSASARLLRAG